MSQLHAVSVPVAVLPAKGTNAKPTLLALPRSATVADLVARLQCAKGATLLVNDCTPATATTLGDLHDCCAAEDGSLRVAVVSERTMGDTVRGGFLNCAFSKA